MRSWAIRLMSSTRSHSSSDIRPSVRSRVTPALWTTTSTPPWRSRRWAASLSRRVLGGDVEQQRRAADLVGELGEVLALGGDVDADDMRAVAREHPRDRGADAARGAGDHRDLPGQRLVPVERVARLARADADHLAGHVGRLGRQQEAQRRLGVRLGARARRRRAGRWRPGAAPWRRSARSPPARAGRRPGGGRRPARAACRARRGGRSARGRGSRRGRTRTAPAGPRSPRCRWRRRRARRACDAVVVVARRLADLGAERRRARAASVSPMRPSPPISAGPASAGWPGS